MGGRAGPTTPRAPAGPSSTGSASDTTYLYGVDGSLLIRRGPDATTLYTGDEEITLKEGATTAESEDWASGLDGFFDSGES